MAGGKSPKSYKLGHTVRLLDRENETITGPAPIKERRATFAEGIDYGMNPKVALDKCDPATIKEMTADRLAICAEAGLTGDEIAHAFNTGRAKVYTYLSKHRIKLLRTSKLPEVVPGTIRERIGQERSIATVTPDPAAPVQEPCVDVTPLENLPIAESTPEPIVEVQINAPVEEPAEVWGDDDWGCLILANKGQGPTLVIEKHGQLAVRNCELDMDKRYAVQPNKNWSKLRLVLHDDGMPPRKAKGALYLHNANISAAARMAGLELPVRYRLNKENMVGERMQDEQLSITG